METFEQKMGENYIYWRGVIIGCVSLGAVGAALPPSDSGHQLQDNTHAVHSGSCSGDSLTYWGQYKTWTKWKVYVIPSNASKKCFIEIAEKAYSKNPSQRIKFFDDDKKIKNQIAAEKFAWDSSGTVPRAKFPTEWRKKHLIGIINDRSKKVWNRWQIIYTKGGVFEQIKFLN